MLAIDVGKTMRFDLFTVRSKTDGCLRTDFFLMFILANILYKYILLDEFHAYALGYNNLKYYRLLSNVCLVNRKYNIYFYRIFSYRKRSL